MRYQVNRQIRFKIILRDWIFLDVFYPVLYYNLRIALYRGILFTYSNRITVNVMKNQK